MNQPISPRVDGSSPSRLEAVDALRGFALMAIVLIHNLEHYNIFYGPEFGPDWLRWLDSFVSETVMFLFAGKAYATFSLLFGFSFYIQMRNARRRGTDFRARFAWRMLLLIGFSQLHSLIYNGDILLLYALCGFLLIPASSWSDRTVLAVAIVLLLQPICWAKCIYAFVDPSYVSLNDAYSSYAGLSIETLRTAGLWQSMLSNLWEGQLYSNLWQIENGRLCQIPSLFLLGMWLGRKSFFEVSDRSRRFWLRVLVFALPACLPLWLLKTLVPDYISNPTILANYGVAMGMFFNFAFMALLVSLFMLMWCRAGNGYRGQRFIIPFGRMSLTNYIGQSLIGATIYYHFGFDLWCRTGSAVSLLIGVAIFVFMLALSRRWLAAHSHGPLEYIWKKATWLGYRPAAPRAA